LIVTLSVVPRIDSSSAMPPNVVSGTWRTTTSEGAMPVFSSTVLSLPAVVS
jgi:hypothetical protein